jgi:hypothetical protein
MLLFPCRFDRSGNRNRNRRRLSLETLEGRQLMSLGPEFGTPVNAATANPNFNSRSASTPEGAYVVVWDQETTPTTYQVMAQRFTGVGFSAGPQIAVTGNTTSFDPPTVAIDNNGDFVVAWTQSVPGNTDVLAQKFNASGARVGGAVPVAVGTFKQTQPSVAMDAKGDFVVSYTRDTNNNNPDIFAKMYNVNEQLTNVVSVAVTPVAETNSSVSMTPDGRFDVAWESAFSASDHDVFLNQYSASGGLVRSLTIANTPADETVPSVSMDNAGDAGVAWQSQSVGNSSILARRVSASGVLGGPIVIDSDTLARGLTVRSPGHTISPNGVATDDLSPSVALEEGGGAFVVVYDSPQFQSPQVNVAEVSPTGTVTTFNAGPRFGPSVSINQFNQYVVTYTGETFGEINILQRHGQLS